VGVEKGWCTEVGIYRCSACKDTKKGKTGECSQKSEIMVSVGAARDPC
jgi:hypothetical protein